jgi:hypothetical protein
VGEAEARQALLPLGKANMAAELHAMEGRQNAPAPAEHHDDAE